MRPYRFTMSLAAIALPLSCGPAAAQPAMPAHERAPAPVLATASYPVEVSLVDEGLNGFVYRETTHNLRLYTYDADTGTSSACTADCATAWPPIYAPANARTIGQWTTVRRPDGRLQWAYGGKPVYVRLHDSSDTPTGDGIDGKWHLLPYKTR